MRGNWQIELRKFDFDVGTLNPQRIKVETSQTIRISSIDEPSCVYFKEIDIQIFGVYVLMNNVPFKVKYLPFNMKDSGFANVTTVGEGFSARFKLTIFSNARDTTMKINERKIKPGELKIKIREVKHRYH